MLTMDTSVTTSTGLVPRWQRQKFLDKLASRIRDLYIMEMRRWYALRNQASNYLPGPKWDGGQDSAGRRCSPVWPKLAEFVVRRKLDEVRFIRVQFAAAIRRPPYPNQLTGEAAIGQYLDSIRQLPDELERSLLIQGRIVTMAVEALLAGTKWDAINAWSYVLSHPRNELTALFRFCVAASAELPRVQAVFHDAALEEYMRHRATYDQVWGAYIPESLRLEAADIIS